MIYNGNRNVTISALFVDFHEGCGFTRKHGPQYNFQIAVVIAGG
jgi:hypothetical protein